MKVLQDDFQMSSKDQELSLEVTFKLNQICSCRRCFQKIECCLKGLIKYEEISLRLYRYKSAPFRNITRLLKHDRTIYCVQQTKYSDQKLFARVLTCLLLLDALNRYSILSSIRFNVHSTSFQRYGRCIDVDTTLCVYRVKGNTSNSQYI